MMAPDPLDNNRNWVRAAIGLKYLKEGLESFVEDEITNLLSSLLQDIRITQGLPPTARCSLCKLENVLPCPTKGFCYKNMGVCTFHTSGVAYPFCPNMFCTNIAAKIVDIHRYTRRKASGALNYEAPSWKNTDVSKWCSTPWEIAKCFMAASGYADKLTVKDTDCPGILSVLISCQAIQNSLFTVIDPPNDIFCKMRETRNKIMHSATLEVTDAELQQYIDDMVTILNDSKTIQNHPDAVTARSKLNQIKANTLVISSRDELELRKKAIEAIEQKQKELLNQCQQQQTDLQSKLYQTLASLTQAENTSQQKQTDLQSQLDQTMASLTQAENTSQQKQTDLQSQLDQTLTSLTQAENTYQQKQTDLQSKLDQTMASLTQADNTSTQKQADLQSKLDQKLASIAQADTTFLRNQTYFQSNLDQAMNSLSHNQAICQQNQNDLLSKCDETMTSLAQAERQCQQKQHDIQSSHGQLYVTVNRLQTQMAQVLEVLKKCQLDIDHVRSDLQKGTDTHEEHVHILENRLRNRQLLQTRLREKYVYESNIPLSPITKSLKVDINKVYQKLVIRPDLIHDPSVNTKAKRHFKRIETKKAVNGYREIFFNNGEPCKNIFVVGNGGVGKTTWCLKLLNSWINCKTNTQDKDEIFLQRFEYIFYVQLRHTKEASKLNDMIKSYLFSDELDFMNTVNDVLLNDPEHCLVLLDGLDEWKLPSEQRINDMGLPHDPMHSKYTTLITSRPWKLEILRLKPPAIDKAVEIKGLDQTGILQLSGHIIDQFNCDRNRHKKVNVFMDCIKNRKMPMIEAPLMLSIFVYLWYENDFIDETFAGLYGKLIVDFFKHAEGDKRQIKQNLEVSKLADIKDIETRKTKWSNISISLPGCLSKGWCKSYSPLLYSLGKLAFYGILSKKIETFLVFTQDSIEEYMSEEELEVALYIGILSQSQSIGDSTGTRFSISFMHKTIQEFFASVYMVSATENDETVNINSKFISYCKKIENVFEIENILIFICGMDPKLAGELTRHISIMHKNNKKISYVNSDNERLHQTLLRCVKEEHLYLSESNHVYIVNHFIKPGKDLFVKENQTKINTETFSFIQLNHARIPMRLYIELYTEDIEEYRKDRYEYEDVICRCLNEVDTLEMLIIYDGFLSLSNDKGCRRISECINHVHFQTLELINITGNLGYIDLSKKKEMTDLRLDSIQTEELSLPQDGCLESVELKSIDHPYGGQVRFTLNMDNQQYLKQLTLFCVIGNVGHINLSNNSKLKYLRMTIVQLEELSLPQNGCLELVDLKSITHPHRYHGKLILNMNNQPYLKQMTLKNIIGNVGQMDLSNNSKLANLNMNYIHMETLLLPQDGCLEAVVFKRFITHSRSAPVCLLNIDNQPNLIQLKLEQIKGNIGNINLSYNSKLTELSMASLHLEELSLPLDGRLRIVQLKSINRKHEHKVRLQLNMNTQQYLQRLTLEKIIGNIGHINMSNYTELTDISMTSIEVEELSLPHDGCLQSVELKSMKHLHGDLGKLSLSMNNQLYLKRLFLKDITGNDDHIDLSNNAELTELSMTSVQLKEVSLPQAGCLQSVQLESLKHPDGVQGSLTLNINNQPDLERLTLNDIIGNSGHINLINNTALEYLSITSIQIKELSLPQDGCLNKIELKCLEHPGLDTTSIRLNLNNQPYLYKLTLEDIIGNIGHINLSNNSELEYLSMTSIQVEELSLPKCGGLVQCELKCINNLPVTQESLILNMNNQLYLERFTLVNIPCSIGHIDLSKNSQLKDVSVISVPLVCVTVPPGVAINS